MEYRERPRKRNRELFTAARPGSAGPSAPDSTSKKPRVNQRFVTKNLFAEKYFGGSVQNAPAHSLYL
jgi:hypothetical protein